MSKLIESTIKKACDSFRESVASFDLRAIKDGDKDNGFPERNLSFHFAKCFGGFTFMEVPFEGSNKKRNDNHIDFFVGNKNIGIFGETKQLYSIQKFREICDDAERLNNKKVLKRILKRSKIEITEVYILILAEAWEIKNPDKKYKEYKFSEWWKSSDYYWQGWGKWDKEYKASKLKNFDAFGSQELISIGDYSVQCLYAYQRIW